MLATPIFIFDPNPVFNGDNYLIDSVFFSPSTAAVFLNIGDTIKDSIGNEYTILNFSLPFADGGAVTVQAITANVMPVADSDFDSVAFTPNQKQLTPFVQTPGEIFSSLVFDTTNYEYEIICFWTITSESNAAILGDRITDKTGTTYQLSFIGPNRFDDPVRVIEVDRIGILPETGAGTLFRSTPIYNLYQGNKLTDQARTVVYNRDNALIDDIQGGTGPGPGPSGGTIIANRIPVELPNGSTAIFTLPSGEAYVFDSLLVFVNGLQEKAITQLSGTQFQITQDIPVAGDTIRLAYSPPAP